MSFDWPSFLQRNNIEFVSAGRADVSIRCPYCTDDPSFHMGVSLHGKGWNCWRNSSHRGKSRAKLIQALLKCGHKEAELLAYGEIQLPADEDLLADLQNKLGGYEYEPQKPKHLSLPKEFKPLRYSTLARPFREYLYSRGYTPNQVDWLCDNYDLHYATRGRFSYRVLLPIHNRYEKLQTWTGRAIQEDTEPRYFTLSKDASLAQPKELLLGLPLLWSAPSPRALLICEGPFDAMWITTFGRAFGVYATCLFGLSLSEQQMLLLEELRDRFDYMGLLLDNAAGIQAFRLANSGINLELEQLPEGVKDPAVLRPQEVVDLCLNLIN